MNSRLIFTIMAAGVMAAPLTARQLDASEALNRAEMFVPTGVRTPLSSGNAMQPLTLKYTATDRTGEMNTVYVFGRGENGGFVVVAADDVVQNPLLGYADSGTFDAADMPPSLKWWIEEYGREIKALAANEVPQQSVSAESDTRAVIAPIVKTQWNQTTPYNDYCPVVKGVRCPSGCVATAMAQVMSVYKYPEKGRGQYSYKPYDVGYPLSVDFGATRFEWDKMLDSYDASSPADAEEAVANLMYALGVSVGMQYTPTSSGGSFETAAVSLVKYFMYDGGIQVYERDYYPLEQWVDAMYAELESGRPLLYGGRNSSAGHAFVIDGYRKGEYFHVNWGWGGMSNGYFRISALDPAMQGVGGSAEGYNRNQIMVLGIQPPVGDSVMKPRILLRGDLTTGSQTYYRSDGAQVQVRSNLGFMSQSVEPISVQMGVKCVDVESGDSVLVMNDEWHQMSMSSVLITYKLNVSDFPEKGIYEVSSGFKTEDGEWHDCIVRMDRSGKMRLVATNETLAFGLVDDAPEITVEDFELASPVYSGRPVVVNASIHVEGRELLDDVRPVLISRATNKVVAYGEIVSVNVPVGETVRYSWEGNMSPSFKPGEYSLQLRCDGFGLIGPSVDVTVKPTPTEEAVVTGFVEIDGGTHGQSADDVAYVGTTAHIKITVTCTQGYFASPACAWIYYNDIRQVRGLGNRFIALDNGQTYKREVDAWLGDLEPGHVYQLRPWALNYGVIGNPVYFQVGTDGIDEVEAEDVGIWPNPAVGSAMIHSVVPMREVMIYALSGALCGRYDAAMDTSAELNVENLPSGIYVVKAVCADGSVASYKLVKR
ncbi:MAG: thiol protease/hemagglutinin PrtT [Paramuribaculum sp.]|nr:thiol protease/hemagglutinin PrtT [Paramuribaculum sp.]